MDKLSMEDKAKRYDEVIERAKKVLLDCTSEEQKVVEYITPELAESEDERIRKGLIALIKECLVPPTLFRFGLNKEDTVAWLEKQGEHANFRNAIQIGDKVTRNEDGVLVNLSQLNRVTKKQGEHDMGISETTKQKLEDNLHKALEKETPESWNEFLDEQGEQKSVDGVKPKFHEGDIIRHKEQGFTCKIIAIDTEYRLSGCNGNHLPFDSQDAYELVEQKPAEEVNGEDYGIDGLWHAQRILEKTLGEVDGYQSDDGILEHKCAISAVKKLYEKKPIAWSEEDEKIIKTMCKEGDLKPSEVQWLKSLKDRVHPQPKQEWSEDDERYLNNTISYLKDATEFKETAKLCIDWLKSLSPQNHNKWHSIDEKPVYPCNILYKAPNGNIFLFKYMEDGKPAGPETSYLHSFDDGEWMYLKDIESQSHWKPSDEQMKVLKILVDTSKGFDHSKILESLYNDLKKLKN